MLCGSKCCRMPQKNPCSMAISQSPVGQLSAQALRILMKQEEYSTMGTTKTRVAAMSLAAMLFLSAIAPAFAESGTSYEAGTESTVTVDASGMSTAAYLIPVEREQSEINGEMVITDIKTERYINDATIPVPSSGMTSSLDEATKQTYYQEYIKIAAEVSKETELDISVVPMNEFQEEDWRTPEQFRNIITEVANWNLTCTELVEHNV